MLVKISDERKKERKKERETLTQGRLTRWSFYENHCRVVNISSEEVLHG